MQATTADISRKQRNTHIFILLLILAIGAVLRLLHLNYQGLWADELSTMNEASPHIPWSQMFYYLKGPDQHPPLFFILERFAFNIWGQSEFVIRIIPVCIGIASIWCMYLLGREVLNARLGLIAAAMLCINHEAIYFSREARGYALFILTGTLSFLFFLRIFKHYKKSDIIGYAIATAAALYTHYFALFLVVGHLVLSVLLWLLEKENRKKYLISMVVAELLTLILYLPCFSLLLAMSNLHSFWLPRVRPFFFIGYFFSYFGDLWWIQPLVIILGISFLWGVYKARKDFSNIKSNPVLFSFLYTLVVTFFVYIIPYIRTVLMVPMLVPRYTIVVLPGIIICLALGITLIKNKIISTLLLCLFLGVSAGILIKQRYSYTMTPRFEFKEMTSYITAGGRNYPILHQKTGWHQYFYLEQQHYTGRVFIENREAVVDSLLQQKYARYANIDTFWLIGTWMTTPADTFHLSPVMQARVDATYSLIKSKTYYYHWVQLYGKKKPAY